jgi:hypothetical protein
VGHPVETCEVMQMHQAMSVAETTLICWWNGNLIKSNGRGSRFPYRYVLLFTDADTHFQQ